MLRLIKNWIPLIAVMGAISAAPQNPEPASGDAQLATVKQYCVACHNNKAKTGGVSFERNHSGEHR